MLDEFKMNIVGDASSLKMMMELVEDFKLEVILIDWIWLKGDGKITHLFCA
jgi:hypothetical protein